MQHTTKLNLNKPDLTDYVIIADLNENMDILDAAVGDLKEGTTVIPELQTADKTLAGGINEVKSSVTTHIADGVKHITASERSTWNDKETPSGAQSKADAVQTKLTMHLADYIKHPAISATGGTSKAYTVTLDPAPLDIPEFFGITIIPHVTNVASPTLNVNGKGVIALKDQKGVAYAAGKLLAGKPYMFRKVGSDFLADSGSGGGGNLQPNQALAGFTFTNDEGEQVGLGDVDLIPNNIKKDINIFGVVGTVVEEKSPNKFSAVNLGAFSVAHRDYVHAGADHMYFYVPQAGGIQETYVRYDGTVLNTRTIPFTGMTTTSQVKRVNDELLIGLSTGLNVFITDLNGTIKRTIAVPISANSNRPIIYEPSLSIIIGAFNDHLEIRNLAGTPIWTHYDGGVNLYAYPALIRVGRGSYFFVKLYNTSSTYHNMVKWDGSQWTYSYAVSSTVDDAFRMIDSYIRVFNQNY